MIRELKEQVKQLQFQRIDAIKYNNWNYQDVVQWILSLERGRFMKYEKSLNRILSEEEVCGEDLVDVKRDAIKSWGIKTFSDITALQNYIDDLVQQQQNDNEVDNGNNVVIEGDDSGRYFR